METHVLAALILAAGLAGFTQGFAGFGSTLVALPVLATFFEMRVAVPVCCLMALGINLLMVARLRGHVRLRELALLLGASLPGMVLGVWLLDGASEVLLKGLLGACVLLLALDSLRCARNQNRADSPAVSATPGRPAAACQADTTDTPVMGVTPITPDTGDTADTPVTAGGEHLGAEPGRMSRANQAWAVAAGLVAGCLGVAIGINGPPVVAWASRQHWPKDALRATLTSFFLSAGLAVVGVQAAHGLVTPLVLGLLARAVPTLLAGLWLGSALCGRVEDSAFRRVVFGLLAATGAALLWQAGAA